MSTAPDLFSQALSLPSALREELANLLFESLPADDDSPIEISEELQEVIERRLEEIRNGTAKTTDLASVMESLRATLASKRAAR
jgi:hypothetical protein